MKRISEARFYMLPKIHKKGVPGRPICSSVNHPTSRISKLVDEHIKEYVPKTKSYIRDTQDFIKKIKDLGPIPEGSICTPIYPIMKVFWQWQRNLEVTQAKPLLSTLY